MTAFVASIGSGGIIGGVSRFLETFPEPLIAVYTWSGEVVTLSSYT